MSITKLSWPKGATHVRLNAEDGRKIVADKEDADVMLDGIPGGITFMAKGSNGNFLNFAGGQSPNPLAGGTTTVQFQEPPAKTEPGQKRAVEPVESSTTRPKADIKEWPFTASELFGEGRRRVVAELALTGAVKEGQIVRSEKTAKEVGTLAALKFGEFSAQEHEAVKSGKLDGLPSAKQEVVRKAIALTRSTCWHFRHATGLKLEFASPFKK